VILRYLSITALEEQGSASVTESGISGALLLMMEVMVVVVAVAMARPVR
jgi:hypothetical protein